MASPKRSIWKIERLREQQANRESHPEPARNGFFVPLPSSALALGILAAIVIGASVFVWTAWPRDPGNDSAEAGFLRDMFVHHAQAVEMSMIIRDRTEDDNLFAMATDIALTQSTQMGTMQGYLDLWGLPLTGEDPAMTWMGMPTEGLMPGMATADEIAQLQTLPIDQAEILFLQLMIRHHQGGVEMSEAALDRCDEEHVRDMAERIITLQSGEIDAMNQMLQVRGADPITDPLPEHEH
jgi:uncharacterized protein (DUF305 family)